MRISRDTTSTKNNKQGLYGSCFFDIFAFTSTSGRSDTQNSQSSRVGGTFGSGDDSDDPLATNLP